MDEEYRAPEQDKSLFYKAKITNEQFRALGMKFDPNFLKQGLEEIKSKLNRTTRNTAVSETYKQWLNNSWNTERIIRLSLEYLADNTFALQWTFPQAYYAVYCSLCAVQTAKMDRYCAHKSIIREFSALVKSRNYPNYMSFYAEGCNPIKYVNLENAIKGQNVFVTAIAHPVLCHFMKSTREIQLDEMRGSLQEDLKRNPKLANKKGSPSKKLNKEQWEYVDSKVHATTVLDLLYRKRIKANYKNVDTFQSDELNASQIGKDVLNVVFSLNTINEAYISKIIGLKNLRKLYGDFAMKCKEVWLQKRLELVESIYSM